MTRKKRQNGRGRRRTRETAQQPYQLKTLKSNENQVIIPSSLLQSLLGAFGFLAFGLIIIWFIHTAEVDPPYSVFLYSVVGVFGIVTLFFIGFRKCNTLDRSTERAFISYHWFFIQLRKYPGINLSKGHVTLSSMTTTSSPNGIEVETEHFNVSVTSNDWSQIDTRSVNASKLLQAINADLLTSANLTKSRMVAEDVAGFLGFDLHDDTMDTPIIRKPSELNSSFNQKLKRSRELIEWPIPPASSPPVITRGEVEGTPCIHITLEDNPKKALALLTVGASIAGLIIGGSWLWHNELWELTDYIPDRLGISAICLGGIFAIAFFWGGIGKLITEEIFIEQKRIHRKAYFPLGIFCRHTAICTEDIEETVDADAAELSSALTAKDAIAAIKSVESVEELTSLAEGETRVTVLRAFEARTAELTDAESAE